jgi:hypothetical protein
MAELTMYAFSARRSAALDCAQLIEESPAAEYATLLA